MLDQEHKEWLKAARDLKRAGSCKHAPPRQTAGLTMGALDTCKCGATTYVLRHKGNDGSNRAGKRWDYWKGVRP